MSSVAPVSVAPMMECTDRHFRYFLRQITRQTLQYTEMIHARRVLDPDRRARALAFDEIEHPIAIQLGGDDPVQLAEASLIAVGCSISSNANARARRGQSQCRMSQ